MDFEIGERVQVKCYACGESKRAGVIEGQDVTPGSVLRGNYYVKVETREDRLRRKVLAFREACRALDNGGGGRPVIDAREALFAELDR